LGAWVVDGGETESSYYGNTRTDIASLLPARARRIVDVGCGAGATLRWLRSVYPEAHTIALEGNANLKGELTLNAGEAHIVDLNGEIPDLGSPDLMLFLDVLEHLPRPEEVLERFVAQLADGGTVIVSVPNVAHLSVSLPLLLKGEFTYRDAGILDRTHLRFFNMDSSVELMRAAGLIVDQKAVRIYGRRDHLIDRLSFGALRSRLASQLLLRGRCDAEGSRETRWGLVSAR
jgi:2-polyprenyl-3-methyl-5-hydroxy-6-metoxy-1,4-benzoquinol methylase